MSKSLLTNQETKELEQIAGATSAGLWRIGDITNNVIARYEAGTYKHLRKWHIYNDIGKMCQKSGDRVQQIARVAGAVVQVLRDKYPIDFGYFERVMSLPDVEEWFPALDWLMLVKREELDDYIQDVPVGQFIFLFREYKHRVWGERQRLHADCMPADNMPPAQRSLATPFGGLIAWAKRTRDYLRGNQTPAAKRIYDALDIIEAEIPALLVPSTPILQDQDSSTETG